MNPSAIFGPAIVVPQNKQLLSRLEAYSSKQEDPKQPLSRPKSSRIYSARPSAQSNIANIEKSPISLPKKKQQPLKQTPTTTKTPLK